MRIYLAGPMTGKPHFNYEAFQEATRLLRAAGHIVTSPVQLDMATYGIEMFYNNATGDPDKAKAEGFDLRQAAIIDLNCLINSEAIALLPGFEESRGAMAELAVAKWMGLETIVL